MDLGKFKGLSKAFEEGVVVQIVHPSTQKELGMTVTVASYQSERVKSIQRRLTNESLRLQKRNPRHVSTVEDIEGKAHDLVIAAVISWDGFEENGKPLECTPENVRRVLEDPDLWFIGEQIDKAADDQDAFIGT